MINLQKLVGICGCELPTNVQNFTQENLTKVKIFQKVLGATFLKHPVHRYDRVLMHTFAVVEEVVKWQMRGDKTTRPQSRLVLRADICAKVNK